ncbi:hypothetical protein FOZ61_011055, partial [Perkinsus olseni]
YTCGKLLCLLLLLAHIVACLWWLLGGVDANNIKTDDHNGADTEYWPFKFSHQFTDSNLTPYAHSMFYSIGMMTTFGFFDISPSNTLERSFTMAIMYAFVVGAISRVMASYDEHESYHRTKMKQYTQFMRSHCIKDDLQTKVRRYIDHHKFDKDLTTSVHYAPMDIVYYKGDLGNSTYWITSVKIREIGRDDLDKMASNKDRDPRTSVLGGVANAALGRWATDGYADNNNNLLAGVMSDTLMFVDESRRATAICQTFVEVVTITRNALQEQLYGNSDWLKLYFKEAALIACANNNDAELNRLLARKFIDITTRAPKTREHLIHIAAYYKSSGVVKALLEREADVNAELEDGKTALHIAVYNEDRSRNLKKIEMLLDTMDIHSKARAGDVEGVRDALLGGCEAGWIHPKTGTTPLYNAVHKGHHDVAALIHIIY